MLIRYLLVTLGLLLAGSAIAAGPSPGFPAVLNSPDMTATALPFAAPFDPGPLPASRQWQATLAFDIANDFRVRSRAGELLQLDGESRLSRLQLLRGLGECWALGLQLRHLDHGGGSLDGFIENWHDSFGLPQNGRDNHPRGQLSFRYQRHGTTLLDIRGSASGVGDSLLSLHRRAACRGVAWQFGVKLPSGDASALTGSGAADAYAGAISAGVWGEQVDWRAGAWLQWLGQGDLALDQRDAAAFLNGSLSWRARPDLRLDLQLSAHSPFYHSQLRELGDWSGALGMGGHYRIARDWVLSAAVYEDIFVGSAADVVFHLSLQHAF